MWRFILIAAMTVLLESAVLAAGSDNSIIIVGGKAEERGIIIVGSRVTNISGATITVADKNGKEHSFKAKSIDFGPSGSRLKVGDVVSVKNGVMERAN